MILLKSGLLFADNGGRRAGVERRQFHYNLHIPERRYGQDRRNGKDRRSGKERREITNIKITVDLRSGKERRAAFRIGT